jgi:hypothetical protein
MKNCLKTQTGVLLRILVLLIFSFNAFQCSQKDNLKFKKGDHIVLVGNNLGSRMMEYGLFETEMHVRYPDSLLYIRNMSMAEIRLVLDPIRAGYLHGPSPG